MLPRWGRSCRSEATSPVSMTLKFEQNILKCCRLTNNTLILLTPLSPFREKKKITGNSANSCFHNKRFHQLVIDSKVPPPLQVCIWGGRETPFHHGVTVTISPLFLELFKNLIFFFKVAIFGIEIPEHRGNKLVVLK